MFDVGWPELLVIAIVLIVVVGPEDLPRMLRAFGKATSRMRSMASEFRTQFDEALKEADLDDVRKTISDAQKLNPTKSLRDAMNPLRQVGEDIRSGLNDAVKPGSISKPDETLATTNPIKPSVDIGSPAPGLNGSTQATSNGASAESVSVPKTRKAVRSKTAAPTKTSAKKTPTAASGNGKAAKPAAGTSARKPAKATASKPAAAKIAPAPASGTSGKAPAARVRKTAAAGKAAPAGKPAPRKTGRKNADEADT